MDKDKQLNPAPIVAGLGAFFLLLFLGQSGWTIAGGTVWIFFITWYSLHYESEKW